MTTLQKIKELLELGYEVEVGNHNNTWRIIYYIKGDETLLSKMTGEEEFSLREADEGLWEDCKILRIIPKKPKLLEVGRNVKCIENGKVYEIIDVDKDGYNAQELMGLSRYLRPHEVIPVYDDEETVTVSIVKDSHLGAFIENKTYNKSEFEKAVKDLKEVK
jgi:hypothetical protein